MPNSTPLRGRLGLAVLSVTALTAITACGSGGGEGAAAAGPACETEYTIGLSVPVSEADFVVALKERVTELADEQGCITMLYDSTTANNLQSQRATLESWLTQQVDAIVVLPVDPPAVASLQRQAQDDGIRWLTYAFDDPTADGSTGIDSDANGQAVAEYLTTWVQANVPDPSAVSAMVTTSTPLKDVASGRWTYPIEALEALGVRVVSQQDCLDRNCGLQIGGDVLRANPDLRIVVGFNDDAALGAAKAFTDAGVDPATTLIIGQDATPEVLEAIQAGGPIKASVGINLEDLAQAIVAMPLNAVEGRTPTDAVAGVVVASPENPEGLQELLATYRD